MNALTTANSSEKLMGVIHIAPFQEQSNAEELGCMSIRHSHVAKQLQMDEQTQLIQFVCCRRLEDKICIQLLGNWAQEAIHWLCGLKNAELFLQVKLA